MSYLYHYCYQSGDREYKSGGIKASNQIKTIKDYDMMVEYIAKNHNLKSGNFIIISLNLLHN